MECEHDWFVRWNVDSDADGYIHSLKCKKCNKVCNPETISMERLKKKEWEGWIDEMPDVIGEFVYYGFLGPDPAPIKVKPKIRQDFVDWLKRMPR